MDGKGEWHKYTCIHVFGWMDKINGDGIDESEYIYI